MSPKEMESLYMKWKERREPTLIFDKTSGVFRNMETSQSEQKEGLNGEEKQEKCFGEERKHVLLAKKAAEPLFIWRHIKPAERCELCGKAPVEYEVEDALDGTILRRCKSCFDEMRRKFANAEWCCYAENDSAAHVLMREVAKDD